MSTVQLCNISLLKFLLVKTSIFVLAIFFCEIWFVRNCTLLWNRCCEMIRCIISQHLNNRSLNILKFWVPEPPTVSPSSHLIFCNFVFVELCSVIRIYYILKICSNKLIPRRMLIFTNYFNYVLIKVLTMKANHETVLIARPSRSCTS